ncbi:hypothetical protein AB0910_01190 [Streptomyces sp. NPDC047002]|uniref:hypothetical protein n=1 Tax=Streptomyces sp. NPDC047002 TaxID=3155475 RepID=UPI003455C8EC
MGGTRGTGGPLGRDGRAPGAARGTALRRVGVAGVCVSSLALLAAVAHALWPDLRVDAVTAVLLAAAAAPWLGGIFSTITLPGGASVTFRDLQNLEEQMRDTGELARAAQERGARLGHEMEGLAATTRVVFAGLTGPDGAALGPYGADSGAYGATGSGPYGADAGAYGAAPGPYGADAGPYGAYPEPYGVPPGPFGVPREPQGPGADPYGPPAGSYGTDAGAHAWPAPSERSGGGSPEPDAAGPGREGRGGQDPAYAGGGYGAAYPTGPAGQDPAASERGDRDRAEQGAEPRGDADPLVPARRKPVHRDGQDRPAPGRPDQESADAEPGPADRPAGPGSADPGPVGPGPRVSGPTGSGPGAPGPLPAADGESTPEPTIPHADHAAPGQGVPGALRPGASAPAAGDTATRVVAGLARRYTALRASAPGGPARTAEQERIFANLLRWTPRMAGADARELLGSRDPGTRLAGIALANARPEAAMVEWLPAAVLREPLPFLLYWGLEAVGRVVEAAGPERVTLGLVAGLRDLLGTLPPGSDRRGAVLRLLDRLDAQSGRGAPRAR